MLRSLVGSEMCIRDRNELHTKKLSKFKAKEYIGEIDELIKSDYGLDNRQYGCESSEVSESESSDSKNLFIEYYFSSFILHFFFWAIFL